MAAVIQQTKDISFKVVSLGTGLKCSNPTNHVKGELRDLHAEIIARRGFIRYILNQLGNLFDKGDDKLELKRGIYFHFYVTAMPCGDASMSLVKQKEESKTAASSSTLKTEFNETCSLKRKFEDTSFDKVARGHSSFNKVCYLRTKPGRSDAETTESMSCSDKMALWNCVGIQGALLSNLINPIYLESITISAGEVCDLKRAVNDRVFAFANKLPNLEKADMLQSEQFNVNKLPCPSSISWYEGIEKAQVCIEGRKLGSKKQLDYLSPKFQLDVSTEMIYQQVLKNLQYTNLLLFCRDTKVSVEECKLNAVDYQKRKQELFDSIFSGWIQSNPIMKDNRVQQGSS